MSGSLHAVASPREAATIPGQEASTVTSPGPGRHAFGCPDTAVAAGVRPRAVATWAMMAVAATAPMNGLRVGQSISVADLLLGVAIVGLLAEPMLVGRGRSRLEAGFWLGLAMVMLGGVLGTLSALRPTGSVVNLTLFGLGAAPVLVVRRWAPDPVTLRRWAWCWVSGATVSAVYALMDSGDVSGRAAGLAAHPNHLAMLSVLGAGLALALSASPRSGAQWVARAAFTALALAVIRSGSRAGLIALVLTCAVIVVLLGRERAPAVGGRLGRSCLVLAAVAMLLATDVIPLGRHNAIQRSMGDATSVASDRERLRLIESGLRTITVHPLTGTGFERVLDAHNVYVQLWAGAGVLGILGFLLAAGTVLRVGLRPPLGDPTRLLSSAFVAGYVGYLATGMVQNFLWDRYLWLHVAVILWMGAGGRRATSSEAVLLRRSG